jgi:hypothetical protein
VTIFWGISFCFFTRTKGFSTFFVVYTIDEGAQKSSLVFNSKLEGVCVDTNIRGLSIDAITTTEQSADSKNEGL